MSKPLSDVWVFEWSFTPPDYFEEAVHMEGGSCSMDIDKGKVVVHVDPTAGADIREMQDDLHAGLDVWFRGAQILSREPYRLSRASVHRLHPNGRRDVMIFAELGAITLTGGSVDIVIRGQNSRTLSDSRRDRIDQKAHLAEQVAKYYGRDPTLALMLDSWKAAMEHPNNELVHLYDIRDAVETRFGKERKARAALSITRADWSRLGCLANSAPLRQGRHRGEHADQLREATESELGEARKITQGMILSYLQYLDKHDP